MSTKRPGDDGDVTNGNGDVKKAKNDIPSGILLFTGATDWDDIGRKTTSLPRSPNTIWQPVRLAALENVQVEAVSSGPASVHIFTITNEGRVYGWGRNEKGQLGLGDTKDRKVPTLVSELSSYRIVKIATGRNHTLFLTDAGEVLACGDNRYGQVGVPKGGNMVKTPTLVNYDGPPTTRVACGADFSGIVDVQGSIWMWGHPEHGQIGNNTEGRYIEKAGKETFHWVTEPLKITSFIDKDPRSKAVSQVVGVSIRELSCGLNHSVAIDEKNRAFSWGFGGYGRLGHSETGSEHVPRLIKFLDGPRRGIRSVVAGGQFNIATSEMAGTVYMWGQYTSSKEANMYPKPIPDLSGWNIRHMACNAKSWMIAADDSVIGCCPSPCFGEMGMGENKKSSASPLEITKLDKVYVLATGMGVSHSVFIARNESDEEKKALEKYEVLDQSE